jgi:hypothetical protein
MSQMSDAMVLAKEWASAMSALKAPQFIIAEEFAWGINQVQSGRHPRIVLKDVLDRINTRVEERRIRENIAPGKKNG